MYTGGSCVSMNRICAGRGLRAQEQVVVVGEVEGVVRRGGRMPVRRVQRGEVVPAVVDLGPVEDLVAEAEEDVLDLAADLGDQVEVPARDRRAGKVTSTLSVVSAWSRSARSRLAWRSATASSSCSRTPFRAARSRGRAPRAARASARSSARGSGRGPRRARRASAAGSPPAPRCSSLSASIERLYLGDVPMRPKLTSVRHRGEPLRPDRPRSTTRGAGASSRTSSSTSPRRGRRVGRAGGGPIVELGVGTGRIAIPVAEAGVR